MHLLVPLLFHDVTSLHPSSIHGNDFSTCSTHFTLGQGSIINAMIVLVLPHAARAYTLLRIPTHTDNASFDIYTRACKCRRSVNKDVGMRL